MGTLLNQVNWKSLGGALAVVLGMIDPGHTWSAGIQTLIIGIGGAVVAIDHVVSAYVEGVHTKAVTAARTTAVVAQNTAQTADMGQSLAAAMGALTGTK